MESDSRFYGDLAPWWPLISPAQEYAEEAAYAAGLLKTAGRPVREVLELGSGGGSNAVHLKEHFDLTLTDLSAEMLAVSAALNPECAHQQGDMRTIRLGRDFDAVFVHDAIEHMTTEDDLRRALGTAYVHCRPGGVALFMPDDIAEKFDENTDHGGGDGPDGRAARYMSWSYDPDPADTWTITEYAFLLRAADGTVRAAHETHRYGLYPAETWLRLLREAGFRPERLTEETSEDRAPRELFLGHRPA